MSWGRAFKCNLQCTINNRELEAEKSNQPFFIFFPNVRNIIQRT